MRGNSPAPPVLVLLGGLCEGGGLREEGFSEGGGVERERWVSD